MYRKAIVELPVGVDGSEVVFNSKFGETCSINQLPENLFLNFMGVFHEEFHLVDALLHHPG